MRLAAIYIHKHDFLFNEPQTINLGGKNIYKVEEKDNKFEVIIEKENLSFIDNFWGDNISLVSAIVGENGTGKTSILRQLILTRDKNNDASAFVNIIFIYELNDNNFKCFSRLELLDQNIKPESNIKFKFEYYSPVLDYDLQDVMSSINPSSKFNGTLLDHHLNQLEKQVLFNYSDVSDELKIKHDKNFPKFGEILIKSSRHYKDSFLNTYAKIDKDKYMSNFLSEIFKKYENKSKSNQYIHNQQNLIKDIEVTILSILAINNTYLVIEGFGNSKYKSFNDIIEGNDFLEILNRFKEDRISLNTTADDFNRFEQFGYEKFKKFIKKEKETTVNQYRQLKFIIDLFDAFEDFYKSVKRFFKVEGFEMHEKNLLFSNKQNNYEINTNFKSFIKVYRDLKEKLNYLNLENYSMLEFVFYGINTKSILRLSTGEKALLNLYSTIYDNMINSQHRQHQWKNYILLLDEADLGFHPDWKKKFIDSIVNVLPRLFSENKNFKNLQIIFTTHDPLTLSDIPNNNIVYLKKENGFTKVVHEENKPKKSFGANITDLLADSFFIDDGLIGDFAKEKIQETIDWLNNILKIKEEILKLDQEKDERRIKSKNKKIEDLKKVELTEKIRNQPNKLFKYHLKIIQIVDEPILKFKLEEMYNEAVLNVSRVELLQSKMIDMQKEIDLLLKK